MKMLFALNSDISKILQKSLRFFSSLQVKIKVTFYINLVKNFRHDFVYKLLKSLKLFFGVNNLL